MKIKVYSILTILCFLISCMSGIAAAAGTEILEFGTFEIVNKQFNESGETSYWPVGWSVGSGVYTTKACTHAMAVTEQKHSGEYSLKMTGNLEYNTRVYFVMNGLQGGANYIITLYARTENKGRARLRIGPSTSTSAANMWVNELVQAEGVWNEVTTELTIPEDVTTAYICLDFDKQSGNEAVYWDDVSIRYNHPQNKRDGIKEQGLPKIKLEPEKVVDTTNLKTGNLVMNGSFEKGDTAPSFWSVKSGFGVTLSDGGADGVKCLRMHDKNDIYVSQWMQKAVGSNIYKLSFDIKFAQPVGSVRFRPTFLSNADESGDYNNYGDWNAYIEPDGKLSEWKHCEYNVPFPAGTERVLFYIHSYSGAEAYIDNLSLSGYIAEESADISSLIPNGAQNMIVNGGFEGGEAPWQPQTGVWGKYAFISEEAYEGKYSLKVSDNNDPAAGAPWARQVINVDGGAEYLFVTHALCGGLISGAAYTKLEFYSSNEDGSWNVVQQAALSNITPETGWCTFYQKFAAPPGATILALYQRLNGSGTVYFDDTAVYRLTKQSKFDIATDEIFYYSDADEINVTLSGNTSMSSYERMNFDVALKDGTQVLTKKDGFVLGSNNSVTITFKRALMTEKKKEYTVEASIKDANGKILDTVSTGIYVYDRPKNLNADGTYSLNGETFFPLYAYHMMCDEDYEYLDDAGIRAVQLSWNRKEDPDFTMFEKELNTLAKHNVMIMVNLYYGSKPAGSMGNYEYTRKIVERYKDDPRIFAWMIMDETFWSMPYNEAMEQCIASYKLIRDIDDVHPTFMSDNFAATFKLTARLADIVSDDAYPGGATESPTTYLSNMARQFKEAANYNKATCNTLQVFEWRGFWPTKNQLRNMAYQTLFEGSPFGYFSFGDSKKDEGGNNIPIYKTELWDSMCQLGTVDYPMAEKVFLTRTLPTFNEVRSENFWCRSWIYNDELYMVILNRKNDAGITADIPLISYNGLSIGEFNAQAVSGGSGEVSGNGTLSITLEPAGAPLYKITPKTKVDYSSIGIENYVDIGEYQWARKAIDEVSERGIVNKKSETSFAPAEKITRADLALFLVRTLGLTADTTENFDDVDSDKYYAKEIAIGKACGILNGIGDNKFNPEAEISRQDMMTIIARGMGLSEDTDLSGFSDCAAIADYALSSVKAMIATGFIKGNADGTINPLGNTTRAEAAVIMSRILEL